MADAERPDGPGPTTSPGLVVFDCDGVLVDSEPIAHRVLVEALEDLGVAFTYEEAVATFLGRSVRAGLPVIEARLGGPVPDDFVPGYKAALRAALVAEVEAVPGVVDVLDGLAVPTCVASNSGHDVIRAELGRVGLLERFEGRIFSAADVARGKPAPDLFLHAARAMGTPPARCAVVEDTAVGVRAAVAAGMTVFAYAGMTPADTLEAAGARAFHRMEELPALLDGAMRSAADDGERGRTG
jgi:HAD superfamily hydrolase (TIGR01509 family)